MVPVNDDNKTNECITNKYISHLISSIRFGINVMNRKKNTNQSMQDQKLAKVREPVFFKFRKRSILSRRTFETDVLEILQVF